MTLHRLVPSTWVLVTTVLLGACSMEQRSSMTAPNTIPTQTSAAAAMAGDWSSATATTFPSANGCGNFKWVATNVSGSQLTGNFTATCPGNITLSGTATGTLQGTTLPWTATGVGKIPGMADCNFTINATGTVSGDQIVVPYTGQTCLGPVSGTETLKKGNIIPPGGGTPASGDAFDVGMAVIVKGPAAFSSWTVSSQVTNVQIGDGSLCIEHSKLGQWPNTIFFGDPNTLVEGNQWVFMQQNGKWYGGAADWYRPGQSCKGVDANSIGVDNFYNPSEEPLHSWVPKSGELVGFGASTPARAWPDMRTLDQRTNIVTTRWP